MIPIAAPQKIPEGDTNKDSHQVGKYFLQECPK